MVFIAYREESYITLEKEALKGGRKKNGEGDSKEEKGNRRRGKLRRKGRRRRKRRKKRKGDERGRGVE